MEITRICPMCGGITAIAVSDEAAEAIKRYMKGYGYVQDIPLPASEREFVKTGFCLTCQEVLFGEEDEEEDDDDT